MIGLALCALGAESAGAAAAGCAEAPPFEAATSLTAPLVTLVPEQAQGLSISFGRSRAPKAREFFLDPKLKGRKGQQAKLPGSTFIPLPVGTVLKLDPRPLERQEVDGEITPGPDYVAFAQVSDTKEVTVSVCINPAGAHLDPGTYVGSVRITDGRVEEVTVPVTVTLQYPNYLLLEVLAVLLLAAGSWYVWATSQRITGNPVIGEWAVYRDWLRHNIVAFVPAVIAAGGAFLATYWRNPAWGARAPEDWFTLLGTTFVAFSAALAGAASISKQGPGGRSVRQQRRGAREHDGPDSGQAPALGDPEPQPPDPEHKSSGAKHE